MWSWGPAIFGVLQQLLPLHAQVAVFIAIEHLAWLQGEQQVCVLEGFLYQQVWPLTGQRLPHDECFCQAQRHIPMHEQQV